MRLESLFLNLNIINIQISLLHTLFFCGKVRGSSVRVKMLHFGQFWRTRPLYLRKGFLRLMVDWTEEVIKFIIPKNFPFATAVWCDKIERIDPKLRDVHSTVIQQLNNVDFFYPFL